LKVLILHNKYKILGGEDLSTDAEVKLLKENNIEVDTYFVYNNNIQGANRIKIALRAVWSRFQYREVLKKIRQEKYDIVHVQNFFPLLSPSIFYASKKSNTKVVMSVRNYRLICPNALLYVNGKICMDCVGKKIPSPAIFKKCYRKSAAASSAVVAMLSVHNFMHTWKNKIDGFICVSKFVKEQLETGGIDKNKMHVKYNFVTTDIEPNFEGGNYYVYAGRLSEEKGIQLLLDTFKNNSRKLIIVGDGPLKNIVELYAAENKNIIYCGKLPLEKIYAIIANAKALIFPSKWHEPFGRTIVEAFAHGTPVIASSLGGIKEIIEHGYNGFLFDPFKKEDLLKSILHFENITNSKLIRENCYHSYRSHFLPSSNFTELINIYNKVLSDC
jgi:glycosyltransferase involved in cell wall biosynthesis